MYINAHTPVRTRRHRSRIMRLRSETCSNTCARRCVWCVRARERERGVKTRERELGGNVYREHILIENTL